MPKSSCASILYITYDGLTDPLGQSQILPYLYELSKLGYKISILSFEKKIRYLSKDHEIKPLIESLGMKWTPQTYHNAVPVLSTILDIIRMWKESKRIYENDRIDIVHCRSYIPALVGSRLKKSFGIRFIFDMRGFWADERVEGKIWNLKNPVYRMIYNFFKRTERDLLSSADYTISLTERGAREMNSWTIRGLEDRIKVIPCCVDTKHFEPSGTKLKSIREDLALNNNEFVLSYLGSIGTWYMLDEMLDFFLILKKTYPIAKFLIVTHDPKDQIIKVACSKNMELTDIIIVSAGRSEVPDIMAISNLSIFFIRPTFSKMASSPTKLAELLSLGIPIVCNSGIGDVDQIIEHYDAGIVINNFSNNSYAEAVGNYSKKNYNNLRQVAIKEFSLTKGVELYNEVYKKVL